MVALFWLIVVWESMMNPIHEGTAEYWVATVVTSPPVTTSRALMASGSTQPVPVTPKITRYSRDHASTRSSSSTAIAARSSKESACSIPTYKRTGCSAGREVISAMDAADMVLET